MSSGPIDGEGEALTELLGLWLALGLTEGDVLLDGDAEALALLLGETEADGDWLALAELEGETLALGL